MRTAPAHLTVVVIAAVAALLASAAAAGAEDVGDLLFRADKSLAAKDWGEAIQLYDQALAADPANVNALKGLADIYAAGSDYKNQARALEQLVAQGGDTADRLELAKLYETKLGRTDDAVAEYTRIVDAEPRNVDAHRALAGIYLGRKDNVKAAEELEVLSRLAPDDADVLWQLAQVRVALGDDFSAIKALEKMRAIRPRDGAALKLLGTLYNKSEEYNKAERTLRDALDAGADDADVYCQLGVAQAGLKDTAQAETSFGKALAKDPNHRAALQNFSGLLYRDGEYERAWTYADKLTTLERDNVRGHFYRGLAGAATGRFSEAENSLSKVIAAEPANVEARVGLAGAYIGQEKYRDAEKALEQTGDPGAYADKVSFYQGRAAEGLGKIDAAASFYGQAEDRNPKYYDAFYYHGRMEFHRGNYEPAEKALGRATLLEPGRIDAFLMLGALYEKTEKWRDAVRTYLQAKDVDPRNVESYLGLGRSYTALKDWSPAEKELRHALQLDDKSFEARYQLGRMYKAQDRVDDAIPEFEEAVLLDPKHVRARTELGYLYLRKERYDEAVTVLEKACTLDAKDLDANYLLAITYDNLENYANAIKYYERASALAPENYEIQKALATSYRLNGELDKSLSLFEKITREKPDDAVAYEMLGDIYRIKGSEAKKWRRYEREIEFYENSSDFYRRYLALAPDTPNRAFIQKFLEGYEHYRLLQAQEREGVEFYEEW